MKKNIGKTERTIRFVLGFIIIIVGILAKSWWGLIGLIPLATAGISFCPLWAVLGISTNKE